MNQVVNHYENHASISNKANMFINLMNYCEQRKISVFKYVPFTIIFDLKINAKKKDTKKIYEENLEKLKKFIEESQNYVVNFEKIGKYFYENKYNEEKEKRLEKNKKEYLNDKKKRKKHFHKYYGESNSEYDEKNLKDNI